MSAAIYFVADLHLDPETRPETLDLFRRFLRGPARAAAALYILGDLFEVWVGDDDDSPGHATILAELRGLVDAGVPVSFLPGNRDFLASSGFAERSGCQLLPDPTPIRLHGVPALLAHGDALCTDDQEHMAFRARVARADVRAAFLGKPLVERQAEAQAMRQQSEANKQVKPAEIMDVNPCAVDAVLADHGARLLIHGHTHRPGLHGDPVERAVLGAWGRSAVILRCADAPVLELLRLQPDLALEPVASAPLPGCGGRLAATASG
ncbi:MAG TPA: UDP-2,3-diacylglucosamine diphosphatase [Gammaproteobacteria bacterium]